MATVGYRQRKHLRLNGFDYSRSGCYYITLCTHNRQQLFVKSTVGNDLCVVPSPYPQNKIIEKWLSESEKKFGFKIDIYVIMQDHIHFIVRIPYSNDTENPTEAERHAGRSLQKMLQWFKTMTTNEYIQGVKSNLLAPFEKKLWQKSYYDHIIRNEQDHFAITEYILNNPQNHTEDIYTTKPAENFDGTEEK